MDKEAACSWRCARRRGPLRATRFPCEVWERAGEGAACSWRVWVRAWSCPGPLVQGPMSRSGTCSPGPSSPPARATLTLTSACRAHHGCRALGSRAERARRRAKHLPCARSTHGCVHALMDTRSTHVHTHSHTYARTHARRHAALTQARTHVPSRSTHARTTHALTRSTHARTRTHTHARTRTHARTQERRHAPSRTLAPRLLRACSWKAPCAWAGAVPSRRV